MNDRALSLRVTPQQQRAKATVAHLLTTAAALLDEQGADALTTSALAQRADVRIRTVYRYFPNRQAILAALAQRLATEQDQAIGDFALLADPSVPWPVAVRRTTTDFVAMASAQPAQAQLRGALRTSPELRAIDDELNARLGDRLASALRRRGSRTPLPRLREAAATFIAAATAILDRAVLDSDTSPDSARREVARLAETYLGSYLPSERR